MTKSKDKMLEKLNKLFPLPNPTSEDIVEVFRRSGRELKDLRKNNDKD